jgi:hypothetical protein
MSISAEKCSASALKFGCNETAIFTKELIDDTFWSFNQDIFTQDRGYGYWLWKPYFIYLNLLQMKEGDTLFYTDAGVEFVDHVWHLLLNPTNVFLFGNNYNHEHWCKGNITDEILGSRADRKQIQASAMIFKVGDEAKQLVKRWLTYCQLPGFIDDSPGTNNDPEFKEHRHDQAILTCLAYRYGYRLHWWPAMYNDGDFVYDKGTYTDSYPVIFHHHRKRNNEWK